MVIKAQSPAGFAEEYIIESIWNNRFPPGTILPAERELSELIGVTRNYITRSTTTAGARRLADHSAW
ncbi:Fatty acid metabolism regulator protein [Salmonella bongori]|nr:Fatty acid metabolism regulator protein [Salmonella bongori]